uniref:C-type lectin domain-containing protein n=1 Tax=Stegastes partitus TaxID=144197 RepID=A0A3B5AG57_9TELE
SKVYHNTEKDLTVYSSIKCNTTYLPSLPAGWLRFGSKCFMFRGKKDDIQANWSYARSWCKEQGGDLACTQQIVRLK